MGNIEEKVDKLDVKLDSLIGKVDNAAALSNEFLVVKSNMLGLESRINTINLDFDKKLSKIARAGLVKNIMVGILTSIVTLLLAYFVNTVGRG